MDSGVVSASLDESISIDSNKSPKMPRSFDFGGIYKFTAQMGLIYTILVASVYGLTNGDSTNKDIWLILLSTITGIVLPAPKISKRK